MLKGIPQQKIEEVRIASDIVEVVSGYLTLKRRGKNFFGLCPFHTEKTPSFSVNPNLQIFHCFGCKAGGNVFSFLMKIEGISFPEAVKTLAQAAGISLPETEIDPSKLHEKEALFYVNKFAADYYHKNLIESEEGSTALGYLIDRGLSKDVVVKMGLGYSLNRWDGLLGFAQSQSVSTERLLQTGLIIEREGGGYYDRFRGRIMFPIHNLTGQVVAFGARRITEDDSPKYINSPETQIYQKRFILYGLYQTRDHIRNEDRVVLVEGYTDWISLFLNGVGNVVATSGTSLTEDHARLIRRYTKNAIILYDNDSAGAAAALRGADVLLENGLEVKIALLTAGHDPDSYIRKNGPERLTQLLDIAQPLIDFKLQRLESNGLGATSTSRAELTRSLLESVSRVRDPIRCSFLVKDIATKLRVDENILWAEIRKFTNRFRRYSSSRISTEVEKSAQFFKSKLGAAELGLVEVMVLSPELIIPISQNIELNEIHHPTIKNIIQALIDAKLSGEFIEPSILSKFMNDPESSDLLAEMASRKEHTFDPQKLANDYICVIKMQKLTEQINEVRNEMREISPQGIEQKGLLSRYQELLNEQTNLRHKQFLGAIDDDDKDIN